MARPAQPTTLTTAFVFPAVAAIAAVLVGPAADAAFPGGNGRIVVADERAHTISTLRPDGSGLRPIGPARYFASPEYSADGARLTWASSNEVRGDVWVARADGSGARAVTGAQRSPFRAVDPAWSPRGDRLVFVSTNGPDQLWTVRPDGSGLRRVTDLPDTGRVSGPVWSPDGRTIVFSLLPYLTPDDRTKRHRLMSVSPDGGGLRDLGLGLTPDVSPDGTRLVFASGATAEDDLVVSDLDGTSRRTLVARQAALDYSPAWSPDGTTVVFVSRTTPTATSSLWTVRSDGTGQRRLAAPAAELSSPDWQPVP